VNKDIPFGVEIRRLLAAFHVRDFGSKTSSRPLASSKSKPLTREEWVKIFTNSSLSRSALTTVTCGAMAQTAFHVSDSI
jgi:hypothetical protein